MSVHCPFSRRSNAFILPALFYVAPGFSLEICSHMKPAPLLGADRSTGPCDEAVSKKTPNLSSRTWDQRALCAVKLQTPFKSVSQYKQGSSSFSETLCYFSWSGNQDFHTPLWLPNPQGNPFFPLLISWCCSFAMQPQRQGSTVGSHCGSDEGCSIPSGAVTDIISQLLTHAAPVPCALAAPYLPASLPCQPCSARCWSPPTSWLLGWSVDRDSSVSMQQKGIPVPNSANEIPLVNSPILTSSSPFAACFCEYAPFCISSQKNRCDCSQKSFPSSWVSHGATLPLTQSPSFSIHLWQQMTFGQYLLVQIRVLSVTHWVLPLQLGAAFTPCSHLLCLGLALSLLFLYF